MSQFIFFIVVLTVALKRLGKCQGNKLIKFLFFFQKSSVGKHTSENTKHQTKIVIWADSYYNESAIFERHLEGWGCAFLIFAVYSRSRIRHLLQLFTHRIALYRQQNGHPFFTVFSCSKFLFPSPPTHPHPLKISWPFPSRYDFLA